MARSGNHAVLHWMLHDIAASGRDVIWYNYCNGTEFNTHILSRNAFTIYSYEDCVDFGPNDEVLVRDPFNYWASRLKKSKETGTFIDPFIHRELWKLYARNITISFNDWVRSEEYRTQLAARLGFERRDLKFDTWATENGGSSFGSRDVLGHWRLMEHDLMWRCFFDDEIYDLAKRLWPDSSF